MDLGTLGGIIFGVALIIFSIMLGGSVSAFVDMPSVLCVGGGTLAALAIAFPIPKMISIISVTKKTLLSGSLELIPWYNTLVELATMARRDGILALEDKIATLNDEFLQKGLQMLVDGNQANIVSQIMEQEIENMEARHIVGHTMWKSVASYAPAFGMVGTLIGLVLMLKNMSDPSSIGAGLAVALITTFYGAVVANLIASPLQVKLEQRTAEEMHLKKMLLAGILAIQAGDSPRIVGDKLMVYLKPSDRAKIAAESAKK